MYSIGQFSKICNTSVKTLRYYCDMGLIEPSYIDPVTNYRYFDYDKIQVMEKILLLKNLQTPLSKIKDVLVQSEDINWQSLIESRIQELEQEKEDINKKILELKNIRGRLQSNAPLLTSPHISPCFLEERKETVVLSHRDKIRVEFIDQMVQVLFDRAYAFQLQISGKLMGIFHERGRDQTDIELLFPVDTVEDFPNKKILPGGTYACVTVKGAYSQLEQGYETLRNWLVQENITAVGKELEIFEEGLVPPEIDLRHVKPLTDKDPTQFLTKICVLIKFN